MKKALWWGMSISVALCAALVFMGCPDDKDSDPEKILKVTDIPPDVTIFASFLMDDPETLAPDVSGINMQEETTGVFNLYEALPTFLPDTTKPWTGSGEYYVGLVDYSNPDDPQYYFYTTDGKEVLEINTQKLIYNLGIALMDQNKKQTLSDFYTSVQEIQQGQEQLDFAAILEDENNRDAIEILTGVALQSVTIEKYNIKDKTTEIAFSKFSLLSPEKIFDDLFELFMSPAGQIFLGLL